MCGIAGIWNLDGRPVDPATIDRFTDSLAKRGPDGRGVWSDPGTGIALGQRRLAILDLSDDARQPLSYQDGRYWLTYNGEVYNFLEIRAELASKGHTFRSTSDSEVILAAWAEWREEMLPRFNGMWALALFDRKERSLFLARDRFGIKPMLYRLTASQFAFASELKAFRCLDGYHPQIDRESAAITLNNSFALEATEKTLFREVTRLPAGHCGTLRDGRLVVRRWWQTLENLPTPPSSLAEQAEQFHALFESAVKLRMRSDVPIGTCLSGGFDSSAVVCTLAALGKAGGERQANDWQRCFVATFPGAANDERPQAEEVVQWSGVKGNFFPITQTDPLVDIEQALFDFEDVYIGLPTAAWRIYRELRRAKTYVTLDGHGADELMGAYQQADWMLFHDAPSLLRHPHQNLVRATEYAKTAGLRGLAKGLLGHHPSLRVVRGLNSRRIHAQARLRRVFGVDNELIRPAPARPAGAPIPVPATWGPDTRMQDEMIHRSVLPTLLRNFDRISMAHGVEIRMPFLDWRVACFVLALPDQSKTGGSYTKRVAREAMRGRMPESIRASRVKVGFNSPMPEWLSGPLRPWARELTEKAGSDHDLINLRELRRRVLDGGHRWTWANHAQVWQCLNFLWFEQRFVSAA